MTDRQLMELATGCGFDHVGMLNVPALEFNPAVRDMCASDRCKSFGRCWTCPPYCGTLEEIAEKTASYHRGVLVQSTGRMEDDYDVEAMMETEQLQKARFLRLVQEIRRDYPDCLPMASGACTICGKCGCPEEPCRHPQLAIPSMEAYGLVVSKVCEDSGLKYYYGPRTITFISCILTD